MQRHITVDIRRNEGATVRNSFPFWEIPILKVVHGEDSVVEIGEKLVNRDLPDPQDEFVRLTDRYKNARNKDGSLGAAYTHMVYGEFGVQKLAQAIQDGFAEAPEGDLVGETNSSVGG